MRAALGSLCIAAAAAAMPAGAAPWIAPIPLSAHGRAVSGTQVSCRALFGQEPEKRNAKGGLLFGDFLLAKQEKVARSPAGRVEALLLRTLAAGRVEALLPLVRQV